VNPGNQCQICQPSTTTSDWSGNSGVSCGPSMVCNGITCAAGCYINKTFYSSGTLNPTDSCQSCQPGTSTSVWTSVAGSDGKSCGIGLTCSGGVCCGGGQTGCGTVCCGGGQTCGNAPTSTCCGGGTTPCGAVCCGLSETCNAAAGKCCGFNTTVCGVNCCTFGQTCTAGTCH
jgi:hypothetical protein